MQLCRWSVIFIGHHWRFQSTSCLLLFSLTCTSGTLVCYVMMHVFRCPCGLEAFYWDYVCSICHFNRYYNNLVVITTCLYYIVDISNDQLADSMYLRIGYGKVPYMMIAPWLVHIATNSNIYIFYRRRFFHFFTFLFLFFCMLVDYISNMC